MQRHIPVWPPRSSCILILAESQSNVTAYES
jgi:hypothetical protein